MYSFSESNGCFHVPLSANQLCLPSGSSEPTIACVDHFIRSPSTGQCEGTIINVIEKHLGLS